MSQNGYKRPRNEAEKIERRLARYPEALRLVDEGKARPKVAEAVGLLRAGLVGREIADRMGLSKSQAYQLLQDPTDEKNKARKSAYYGKCVSCGGPTAYRVGGAAEYCVNCAPDAYRFWTKERAIAAIREYARRYGRQPKAYDWNRAPTMRANHPTADWKEIDRRWEEGRWPSVGTLTDLFGGWNQAIAAAGFRPVKLGHYHDESKRRQPRPRRVAA